MNRARRGDVFVATVSGQQVPVVVVSRDSINHASPIIVIVPAVLRERLPVIRYGNLVVLPPGTTSLGDEWVFDCTQVRSLGLDELTAPAGTLPQGVMTKIDSALRTVLQLN